MSMALNEKLSAMSLRERVLLGITGMVLLIAPLYVYLLEPDLQRLNALQAQYHDNTSQQQNLLTQVNTLTEALQDDPDQAERERQRDLQQALAIQEQALSAMNQDLVPPEAMADLLQRVLTRTDGITLTSLESLPPARILPGEMEQGLALSLFRHGIKITFSGRYFAVHDYLAALEQLPEQFYWEVFDYQVVEGAEAEVELEIYTVSDSQVFIRG